ncbi:TRAP transporter small permease [Gudongella sp. DL1XJH-153]|uniref:TRAP transporter small permease n=1 Tax=Gudongella sp. DL1XJH-153 TaxID=3409804 RepID=UPI003BB5158C
MKTINRIIDLCMKTLSIIAALALGFLLLGICYSTLSRVAFNKPLTNLVEYSTYSLMYVTFLGSPEILKNKGHINLDLITTIISEKANRILSMIVNIAGAAISAIIFYYGGLVAIDNFVNNIKIMDSMGTPQYLLTATIPIGMFFMTIQFIRNFYGDFKEHKSAV